MGKYIILILREELYIKGEVQYCDFETDKGEVQYGDSERNKLKEVDSERGVK